MRSCWLEWPWRKRCVSCEQPQMVRVCSWEHASARRPAPSSETPRHHEMSSWLGLGLELGLGFGFGLGLGLGLG